jgi:hypothetical protein
MRVELQEYKKKLEIITKENIILKDSDNQKSKESIFYKQKYEILIEE